VSTLFLLQGVVPLVLVAWMGLAPPRAWAAFGLQAVATATAVWTMALLGIWLVPPWWAPHAFGVALAVMLALGLRRRLPFVSALPVAWSAWLGVGVFLVLGVASAYGLVGALRSRSASPLAAVNLSFPLGPGSYLVVNGGSDIRTNAHLMTLDVGVPRFRAWRGQSYGVDIVKLDAFGFRARGVQPADPKAYAIYGARVLAPCAGQVLTAVDSLPDMQVPEVDREHLAGNHVMLRCVDADSNASPHMNSGVEVLLGHLQPGSVQVRAGAPVAVGDWLGSVGNSGNTGEPHLHVHAQRPGPFGAPLGGDPLPLLFDGRFPVRGDRIVSP
jgi:Peptidase family M23